MAELQLHAPPGMGAVIGAQLRTIARGLRMPAAIVLGIVAIMTFILLDGSRGAAIPFAPEQQMLPGVLGLLLPLAVWRGGERLGSGFFWTQPVERERHAQTRIFAGWVWLMLAVLVFVFWQAVVTLVSGGGFLAPQTIYLHPGFWPVANTTIDASALRTVQYTSSWWFWFAPFTGATATYLLSSAVMVGVRSPLKWMAALIVALFLIGGALGLAESPALRLAPSRVLSAVFGGPYGWDALLTARTESLKVEAVLDSGERIAVWRGLPVVSQWIQATLLWLAGAIVAAWAATHRHRESRHG